MSFFRSLIVMHKLITILGPTATGKTSLAANLAAKTDSEIIGADSRQVYKGMDIGTGKDLGDYQVDRKSIPYHLVDIVDPGYEYNVFEFQQDFRETFDLITSRGKIPILCGGTGMYIDSVLRGYKMKESPENIELRKRLETLSDQELIRELKSYGGLHNTTDITDRKRTIRAIEIRNQKMDDGEREPAFPDIESMTYGLYFERTEIRKRITERLEKRLNEGMIREVNDLLEKGLEPEQLTFYGLEYRYVTEHITGKLSFEEMFEKLNTAIHQFSKRQMTWFRRMERNGVNIQWLDGHLPLEQKLQFMVSRLKAASWID
jgi:tRNA dimethylallyltransferase